MQLKKICARMATTATLAMAFAGVSGCQSMAKMYVADEISSKPVDAALIVDGKIDLAKVDSANFDGSAKAGNRRRLGMLMLDLSDRACTLHKATIYSNSANWNIVAGVGPIFLASYASVVDNAKKAADAAALSAAVSGTQATVNQEVYQAKVGTAIARAIDVLRERELTAVQTVMGNADATAAELVGAINRYHSRCSLIEGVSELTRALDNQKPSVLEVVNRKAALKQEIDRLRGMKAMSAHDTQRLEAYEKVFDVLTLQQ